LKNIQFYVTGQALNKSIFGDGRFGFGIPMALRKRFPDWNTVSSVANIQGQKRDRAIHGVKFDY